MKVYLVVNTGNSPGKVLAIFDSLKGADVFCSFLDDYVEVEVRTLFSRQPPAPGYNE